MDRLARCCCGALRAEVSGDPTLVAACHCEQCQRRTGAAFGISALYTGVAGALGAIVVQFVAPDSFTAGLSINFLVGVVIGGLASVSGALWGALFIQFVPNVADHISKAAPWAIYGIFMIAFAYLMPTGVAGFLRMLRDRLTRRR